MYKFWCWPLHKILNDPKNPKTAFVIDFSPSSSISFNDGTSSVAYVKFSNRIFQTGRNCWTENCRFSSFHRISFSTRILKGDNYTNSTWCSITSFSKTTGLSSSNKVSVWEFLKCSYPNGWKHVVFDPCMSVLIIQNFQKVLFNMIYLHTQTFFAWDPQAQFLPTGYQFNIYSTCKTHWQIFSFDLWSKILVIHFFLKVLLKFIDLDTQTLFPSDPKTKVIHSKYQLNFCVTLLYQWKILCFDIWWGILTVRKCQKCCGSSRYSISMFF